MYIEEMRVERFRHLRNLRLGPFRSPAKSGEIIILAGPNGGGKSSVLELLTLGLANRYSYQYYQARQMTEYTFAIKIGLTDAELDELDTDNPQPDAIAFARDNRGYWVQVNMPSVLDGSNQTLNERVHGLVSSRFQNFSRRLGFFIRSDRSYLARNYDQRRIFGYRSREQLGHLVGLTYGATNDQYADMYDFLVEQSYHHVYELGVHYKRQQAGGASVAPKDPLAPYNDLLARLFPGYSFVDVTNSDLALRIQLPSGVAIPFQDMSSGEKEVFFILAFFLRHNINSSVIVVDEPELHLHPELARKFVRLMRNVRDTNQIWLATHSADLIDEAGRERTYYVRRALENPSVGETVRATSDGAELQLLRDLFGFSGYVGISKRIVFTEGQNAGADRKTFANIFPELSDEIRIIPAGSSANLPGINRAILSLLESDFARCEFFLIRDRDYLSSAAVSKFQAQSPRLFILERHEIENYLLDEEVIAQVLKAILGRDESPLRVREQLLALARTHSAEVLRDMVVARFSELFQGEDCSIGRHSSAMAVVDASGARNATVLPPLRSALLSKLQSVTSQLAGRLAEEHAEQIFDECADCVARALDPATDEWKRVFPGKELLQRYSKQERLGDWPALQNLIIERLAERPPSARGGLRLIFETVAGRSLS